jgi:hypothetical protein
MFNLKLTIMKRLSYKVVVKNGVTHIIMNESNMYAENIKLRSALNGKIYSINKI